VVTGVELLAGAAVGYLVRKLRQVGGKADAEVDRVLDEGMDALHELITTHLGKDGALERLQADASAGIETELTVRRSADAIAQAALDDADFAARLRQLVDRLNEHAAATGQAAMIGSTHNMISGGTQHGSVFQGRDFAGPITTGPAIHETAPAAGAGSDPDLGVEGERGKGPAPAG
jgi:hypothetical protein